MSKISVVISIYNGEKYLETAIKSLLDQTYKDFNIIALDDGSTDRTKIILENFKDSRLKIISKDNEGQTKSLNQGLRMSDSEYIARMDDDDISEPTRFEKQISFLENNSDVGLLGTSAVLIDNNNKSKMSLYSPTEEKWIRWHSIFSNPFYHSSVFIRRAVLVKHALEYNENISISQDYDLWLRMYPYTKLSILKEPLLRYRRNTASLGNSNRSILMNEAKTAGWKYFSTQYSNSLLSQNDYDDIFEFINGDNPSLTTHQSCQAVHKYLDMWEYVNNHSPHKKDQSHIKPHVVSRIVSKVIRLNPMSLSWWNAIIRFFKLDLFWFPKMVYRFFYQRRVRLY